MRPEVRQSFDRVNTPRDALARWDASPAAAESLALVSESENFVYHFGDTRAQRRRDLRLTPPGERSGVDIQAELEFVRHLARNGAHVAESVDSLAGNAFETIETPAGDYVATVFEAVEGTEVAWGTDAENRAILHERGRSLGRIHRISATYSPPASVRRSHWYEDDLFTDPLKYLPPSEDVARREYETIIQWMLKRPRTRANYGLIHGDFQSTNTLRRPDGWVVAIDFDECCFHWFMYDVAVSMSAARQLPNQYRGPYLKVMLDGYASEKDSAGEGLGEAAMFCRLAALYRYVTLLRRFDPHSCTPEQRDELAAGRAELANPPTWE